MTLGGCSWEALLERNQQLPGGQGRRHLGPLHHWGGATIQNGLWHLKLGKFIWESISDRQLTMRSLQPGYIKDRVDGRSWQLQFVCGRANTSQNLVGAEA